MVRIDKVYTKGGDRGETSLIGGMRVSKDALRIECYGTVDELNACLGLVRTALASSAAGAKLTPIVARIQNELFNVGTELATPDAERRAKSPVIREGPHELHSAGRRRCLGPLPPRSHRLSAR